MDVPDHLIPVFPAYEERFLCLVLSLLRSRNSRVIYVTSQPILPRPMFGAGPFVAPKLSLAWVAPVAIDAGLPEQERELAEVISDAAQSLAGLVGDAAGWNAWVDRFASCPQGDPAEVTTEDRPDDGSLGRVADGAYRFSRLSTPTANAGIGYYELGVVREGNVVVALEWSSMGKLLRKNQARNCMNISVILTWYLLLQVWAVVQVPVERLSFPKCVASWVSLLSES